MKNIIAFIIAILGIIAGIYVGGWLMFIQPIIAACKAFDAGELTALIIGITVLKCLFATVVGCLIAAAGCYLGGLIQLLGGKSKH